MTTQVPAKETFLDDIPNKEAEKDSRTACSIEVTDTSLHSETQLSLLKIGISLFLAARVAFLNAFKDSGLYPDRPETRF